MPQTVPQTAYKDIGYGENLEGDQAQSALNQPSEGYKVVDSSEPFFSINSNATEQEDNKMVERWQNDANGILIFTGLFSVAVAVLLVVTIQDLRPNSQETSTFYLGSIYEVLTDPNATRASIPSSVAKPPPFSPPRYAVWVNSLWSLSLVMSVSCGMLATSVQHWARRYIRLTQPARCSPEMRARMRAFYANGVDKMHLPWAVEGLPTMLHLSMILFLGGLAIFLFNVDREVFNYVIWWIGLFLFLYGLITILPSIQLDSPYSTPLSISAWFLWAKAQYVTFTVATIIASYVNIQTWVRFVGLRDRSRDRMLRGVEKRAEETMLEQSSKIDVHIFGWTINALGDDTLLEKFFEAIPGLFNSKQAKDLEIDFPEKLLGNFWDTLDGFMGRTSSSNSITKSVKSRRVMICEDILSKIPYSESYIPDNLCSHFNQAPVTIERLQAMARWIPHESHNVSLAAQIKFAKSFARMDNIDHRSIALASKAYGLPDLGMVAFSTDSAILAILIHVCYRVERSDELGLVEALTQFDISHTLPKLRHDFCALWNKLVQEARNQGSYSTPVRILRLIRHLYIASHQGVDAGRAVIPFSSGPHDPVLLQKSSYPPCDIDSHHLGSTAHVPTKAGDLILPSPLPTKSGDFPVDSPPFTFPVPTLPGDLPVVSPPFPVPDLPIASPYGPTPGGSTALRPEATTISGPRFPSDPTADATPGGSEAARSQDVPPFGSTTPSYPTDDAALPRPLVRGLVDTGGMNSVNAVLQLLVHSPPFWNLFRELGDQKKQGGARGPESSGSSTPLVHATVRFCEEFVPKDKGPPLPQQGESSEDEEAEKEHGPADPFEPTYMYGAMKEKEQLRDLLDSQGQDAEEFFNLYLDALEGELSAPSITGIFGGRSRLALRAYQFERNSPEDWRSLRLDIQDESVYTVEDALAHVPHLHRVEPGPDSIDKRSHQMLIEQLPSVLVVHLNRSRYDSAAGGMVKISKPIRFAPELDIPLEILTPAAGKSVEPMHYKLYGVLYHSGESASSGHYTVDVLHPNEDSDSWEYWLRVDDETVRTVKYEDVFGGYDNEWMDDRHDA